MPVTGLCDHCCHHLVAQVHTDHSKRHRPRSVVLSHMNLSVFDGVFVLL